MEDSPRRSVAQVEVGASRSFGDGRSRELIHFDGHAAGDFGQPAIDDRRSNPMHDGFIPRFEDLRLLLGAGRFSTTSGRRARRLRCLSVRRMLSRRSVIETAAARGAARGARRADGGRLKRARGRQCHDLTPVPNGAGLVSCRTARPWRRHGAACRRSGRDGCRRERGRGARRGRAGRRRLRTASGQSPMSPRAVNSGRAAGLAAGGAQYCARLARLCRRACGARGTPTDLRQGAAHVARVRLVNQRIAMAPMEPRGALRALRAGSPAARLSCASQSADCAAAPLAASLDVAADRVRVLTGDVGGAFGMRMSCYPEYPALLSRQGRRPRRALAGDALRMLSDRQPGARHDIEAALALDETAGSSRIDIDCWPHGRVPDLAWPLYRDRKFRALPARYV